MSCLTRLQPSFASRRALVVLSALACTTVAACSNVSSASSTSTSQTDDRAAASAPSIPFLCYSFHPTRGDDRPEQVLIVWADGYVVWAHRSNWQDEVRTWYREAKLSPDAASTPLSFASENASLLFECACVGLAPDTSYATIQLSRAADDRSESWDESLHASINPACWNDPTFPLFVQSWYRTLAELAVLGSHTEDTGTRLDQVSECARRTGAKNDDAFFWGTWLKSRKPAR